MKRSSVALSIGTAVLVGVALFGFSAHATTTATPITTGTLVSVTSTTLPSTLVVQSGSTMYTVNVTKDTVLVRKYKGSSLLDEFGVGDVLQITGIVAGTTINATRIKNTTIQRVGGVKVGKILSINAVASTFVLKVGGIANQTVTVPDSAKIYKGNLPGSFSDLAVGQTVKVVGLWRKSLSTIAADRVLIKTTELNGKVTATSCTTSPMTLTVSVKKGKTTKSWIVTLDSLTVLRDNRHNPITCAMVKAKDTVHIRGFVTGPAAMTALQVHDSTLKKTQSKWSGTITSNDIAGMTFMLDQKKGDDLTVKTTAETLVVDGDGKVAALIALADGHKATVWGVKTGTTVVANLIVDASL